MELDQAIKGYFAKRKELEGVWSIPSQLSDTILKLATYLSYIGDSVGELKENYESERAKAYLRHLNEGKSASNAENLARCETADIRGQVNKLELMLKTGLNLTSIGQSRLKVLESQARNQT
jgi:hypothetical protein